MKKITSIFSLALVSCGLCISCTNLESEMYNVINPGIFPTNEADAEALVVSAAYGPMSVNRIFTAQHSGIQVATDMTTDIADCQWTDWYWPDVLQFNFTSNSYVPTLFYDNYVRDISKMTLTMERIANVPMSEEKRASLMAELHCGRGWLAYMLYDLYGPIQIATLEQLNNVSSAEVAPRLSQEEMVQFIEDDLNAAKVLPASYSATDNNYGRYTRGLVYTVLMKLYMHEGNWAKAIECGRELMKPEYGYGLVKHYKDIFTLENEKNEETIWSCLCSRGINLHMWTAHVLPSEYPTKNPNIQKWSGYRIPWDFYHTFDPTDERLEVLVGDFVGTDGVRYNEENPGTPLAKGALPIKYAEDPDATGSDNQIDWIVFRYADVLTLLSEAIVREANAVTTEAVELLNMVHTRAGLQPYTIDDFVGVDDFLDANLLERGHELWYEGCRRSDLIRYGRYIEYARIYKKSATAQDYMNLWPLPQDVIDESKGKIAQNPGY